MSCPFCSPAIDDEVVIDDDLSVAVLTPGQPLGSAMVMPKAHRVSPFELTEDEWLSTRRLLVHMKDRLGPEHGVNGWNVGWNVGAVAGQSVEHVHCHLVARYADEEYAGRGIRWWIKAPENRRT
jgi:histidine triad (HIT) family protein